MAGNTFQSKSLLLLGFKTEIATKIIETLELMRLGTVDKSQLKGTAEEQKAQVRQQLMTNGVKMFDPIHSLNLEDIKKVPLEQAPDDETDSKEATSEEPVVVYGPDPDQIDSWFKNLVEEKGGLPDVVFVAWSTDTDENASFGYQIIAPLALNNWDNHPIIPVLLDEEQKNLINCDLNPNLAGFFTHGIFCLLHEKGTSKPVAPQVLAAMLAKRFMPANVAK